MRLRWKLLLLLLCVSLLPIFVLRINGQRTMSRLGEELSGQVADALVGDAEKKLAQLAEMHAALLSRERRALTLALELQKIDVEKTLAGSVPQNGAAPILLPNAGRGMGRDMSRRLMDAVHENRIPADETEQAPREFYQDAQSFKLAPGLEPETVQEELARLSALTPSYTSIDASFKDMILWQASGLASGVMGMIPGPMSLPRRYDVRQTPWYRKAMEAGGPVWSPPVEDHATGQLALVAATPVRNPDGRPAGATAIAVSVSALFAKDSLVRHVSPNTSAFLVSLVVEKDGERALRVKVRRRPAPGGMGRPWVEVAEEETVDSDDGPGFAKLVDDVAKGGSGVARLPFEGADSFWAYFPTWEGSALLVVAPVSDVLEKAETARSFVQERIQEQIYLTGGVTLAVAACIALAAIYGARSVTRPLTALTRTAKRLAAGDFTARADVRGHDEIAELGRIFNETAPQLLDRLRMSESLELAMEIQRDLLPAAPPDIPGLDLAAVSVYCDETGGDYYDFFPFKRSKAGRLGLAVGDVTGHGVGAALLMTTARALLRTRTARPGTPADIVAELNAGLTADTYGTGRFMTLFYAEIDPVEKSLVWTRAGHDPAMLLDPAAGLFQDLDGKGMALGVLEDAAYEENALGDVPRGAVLLIGSDGVWETRNPAGEMFGKQRFRDVARNLARENAQDILDGLLAALDAFRGDRRQEDDVTLMVVKFA